MSAHPHIKTAQACATDAREAAQEFHAAVSQPNTALAVFFCSSEYDLEALADELRRLFRDVPLVGCTTAGEIGPSGYRQRSISGASFPAGAFTAVAGRLGNLQQFEISRGETFARSLLDELETRTPNVDSRHCFGFVLIDGMSMREEPVTRTFQHALDDIALFGGSAGDDLKFQRTWVYWDGAFHPDSAALIVVATSCPFKIFKTQHFVCDEERLVVTEADPAHRVVKEINGLPAAEEYARRIGVEVKELTPTRFAASPVVVMIDGRDYVRSIQKANPDGSLTFYCAIDEGLVFRVAHGENLVENLEQTFARIRSEIGPPDVVFACDCILRNLEISEKGLKDKVSKILDQNHAVGFATYGEQYRGVHINQTLTGIAIGAPPEEAHA